VSISFGKVSCLESEAQEPSINNLHRVLVL
jgi:hypothetical protein